MLDATSILSHAIQRTREALHKAPFRRAARPKRSILFQGVIAPATRRGREVQNLFLQNKPIFADAKSIRPPAQSLCRASRAQDPASFDAEPIGEAAESDPLNIELAPQAGTSLQLCFELRSIVPHMVIVFLIAAALMPFICVRRGYDRGESLVATILVLTAIFLASRIEPISSTLPASIQESLRTPYR